eukprot:TRINITY_DN33211_c0_g1_i1.p1 TRINITY_DN33211_c0_g1~~TRINITY_DN33211_c0_g1_i1.p1  ORF type:complete len:748 (-),score=149.21 TRINITY_DN33211_c0_g1_i1:24-2267(-)
MMRANARVSTLSKFARASTLQIRQTSDPAELQTIHDRLFRRRTVHGQDPLFKLRKQSKEAIRVREGSILRAWIHYLDKDHEHRVVEHFFCKYIRERLGLKDDPSELFKAFDTEHTGEIFLAALSEEDSALWDSFRNFMSQRFPGGSEEYLRCEGEQGRVSEVQFMTSLQKGGWQRGVESYLFEALSFDRRFITASDLKWFDVEAKRAARREKAKQKALEEARSNNSHKSGDPQKTLRDFNRMLRRRFHGSLVRGWRNIVFPSDAMLLQRGQFLKACADIGWKQDVKAMWDYIDKDGSGSVTLDEVDLKVAERLAAFRNFMIGRFGNARDAFNALDVNNVRLVCEADFYTVVAKLGFGKADQALFCAIDLENKKKLNEEDLAFLDRWKPREFLTAKANPQAASAALGTFQKKYGTLLRAWQLAIDVDGSNSVNWDEFKDACKHIGWDRDVPGAWRALDKNMRGFITLQELDPETNNALTEFREFAISQFGSVRSCFHVFDLDESGEITFLEFKHACRVYGFQGHLKPIFRALDSSVGQTITMDEIAFLDNWTHSIRADEPHDDKEVDGQEETDEVLNSKKRGNIHSHGVDLTALTNMDIEPDTESDLSDEDLLVKSYASREWPAGSLHPAFRVWANNRRKQPIRKANGKLPSLTCQLDLGSPHAAKRPVLLLAPVPAENVLSAREQPPRTNELPPAKRAYSESPRQQRPDMASTMPSLDALLRTTTTPRYQRRKAQSHQASMYSDSLS